MSRTELINIAFKIDGYMTGNTPTLFHQAQRELVQSMEHDIKMVEALTLKQYNRQKGNGFR